MSDQTIPGTPQLRQAAHRTLLSGERLPAADDVRYCAHPDCSARLSRYNPSTTCAGHGGWTDPPVRRRRSAGDRA